ncbi:3-phenylpropionate/trans-cinnamate dioxygenase ferredoxin reductase subunit [Amycolatopsis pretoriensis]|uniref:3-phenylpropionate/trans-cinnamate dioxygenase ferredoxin reductase subunit n=1 Tax=Amycolatopsis pretoriensis TaxID=218821 RepID=A0A1H5Q525_9PSEU|nr:FAD-dependent oxidoreductase [Amycolatopsis pretoriensis]SEF21193.1 3-phenylpropionate/trans-cinnamate dioxygenase ferredoxin reductase subunit [Amycolatopsis pretoriensis]
MDAFVIAGAGLTGAKAAETLRAEGFAGRVMLVGAEPDLPYERPPLSKGYLLGQDDRASVFVHDEKWYADQGIEVLTGRRVTALDRAAHEIELAGGERLGYTKLLLATGASPRRLRVPGNDLKGVHYLRRLAHADRLRDALAAGGRVVVAGAGWIGLETAAAARTYGCEVTIVEPSPSPLHATLGPELGGFFAELHRKHGVDLRLGTGVTGFAGDASVTAVQTEAGEIPADVVIVGIGARPETQLAEEAGLAVDDGVCVDASLRTEDPDVFAAGDVASAWHPAYDRRIRVEHWAAATNGGPAAALSMLGREVSYDDLPYFFSDQYDVGMEFTGWFPPGGYDRVVTRGSDEAFHAFWLAGGRVVAGLHVNQWDEGLDAVRELIRSGRTVDADALADPARPLPS